MSKAHGEPDHYYRPQHTDLDAFERQYTMAFATRHCPVCGTPMTRRYHDHQRQEHCPDHGHILSHGDVILSGDEVRRVDGRWTTIGVFPVEEGKHQAGMRQFEHSVVRRPT